MRPLFLSLVAATLTLGCVKHPELPPISGPLGVDTTPVSFSLPRWPDQKKVFMADDRGQVVLLDVWATWCEPCKDALPTYEALLKQYGAKGFKVYAINADADQNQIEPFVKETKVSLPILLDPQGNFAESALHVKLMPTTFLIDKKGVIRFVHEGFAEEFLARYQTEIEQLLAEPGK